LLYVESAGSMPLPLRLPAPRSSSRCRRNRCWIRCLI